MSTTDPDARGRAIQDALRPVALALAVAALFIGPVLFFLTTLSPGLAAWVDGVGGYLVWLFGSLGAGLFAFYVVPSLSGLGTAAWIVGVLAGFTLVVIPFDDTAGHTATWATIVLGAAAVILYVLRIVRANAARATLARGVATDSTVTRAAVSGTVNSVQIWHLTLKFLDQQGVTRYLRAHVLGAGGWAPGDTVPIKYDPAHPGSRRRIVVFPDSPGNVAHVR